MRCFFLFLDKGHVYGCGDNKYGQLGIGSQNQVITTPQRVGTTSTFIGKSLELIIIFLILTNQCNHVFRVLKTTVTFVWFFLVPTAYMFRLRSKKKNQSHAVI